MERRPNHTLFRRQHFARRIIATVYLLVIGFSVGVIVTLKVVGFS